MPSYRIAHKPDIMTTYLRGVIRHRPEFLRPTLVQFEPMITISTAGGVTLTNPPSFTVNSETAFIIQKIRGYATHGALSGGIYVPMHPAELAQFRFNIKDESRTKNLFDTDISIAVLVTGNNGEHEWSRGDYLTVPSTTLTCVWSYPTTLSNFVGSGQPGGNVRLGVVLSGLMISRDLYVQFDAEQ